MTNEPKPAAWMHPDGRVVPASTMAAAQRDGGAMKSSLLGYSVRLYDQAVIDAKDAEIEALRKDAARYRRLRDNPWPSFLRSIVVTQSKAAWDTAIDASMKAQAEREAT